MCTVYIYNVYINTHMHVQYIFKKIFYVLYYILSLSVWICDIQIFQNTKPNRLQKDSFTDGGMEGSIFPKQIFQTY